MVADLQCHETTWKQNNTTENKYKQDKVI